MWVFLALYFLSKWRYSSNQLARKNVEIAPSGEVEHDQGAKEPSSLLQETVGTLSQKPAAAAGEEGLEGPGYVLTLKFTGQQVAGMRGIFSQQCWIDSFNLPLSIVEPYIVESMIVHTREVWERDDRNTLKLSNFYNMLSNRTGQTAGSGGGMTSWGTFLEKAPKKLIVVNIGMIYTKGCLEYRNPSTCEESSENIEMNSCKPTKILTSAVNYLTQHQFKVVRQVCLDCALEKIHRFSPMQIVKHIFAEHNPRDVTVLFTQWKFSFQMTPNCSSTCSGFTESVQGVEAPSNLRDDGKHYSEVIDRLQGYSGLEVNKSIAVMVRLEWFLIEYKYESLEHLRTCLQAIKSKVDQIALRSTRIVLALDVGKFGSGSFGVTKRLNSISEDYFKQLLQEVKQFVKELYNNHVDFDAWEGSFVEATGGMEDRGYIAALQSLVVSTADCMVLVGGGHFQQLAIQKHMSSHTLKPCVHRVCSEK